VIKSLSKVQLDPVNIPKWLIKLPWPEPYLASVNPFAMRKQLNWIPKKMFETIRAGAAGSAQMEAFMPMLIQNDFDATFYMKHFIKDLKIAQSEASDRDLKLDILDQILKECQAVESMGYGNQGTQALYHWYEK